MVGRERTRLWSFYIYTVLFFHPQETVGIRDFLACNLPDFIATKSKVSGARPQPARHQLSCSSHHQFPYQTHKSL